MAVVIKKHNSEIDPCYRCCLCGVSPYEEAPTPLGSAENFKADPIRTKDPARPGADLCWLACSMDATCHMVIDLGYRLDTQDATSDFFGLDNAGVIAKISDSPALLREFMKRKDEICDTMRTASEEGAEVVTYRGSRIMLHDGEMTKETIHDFEWYKWSDYQASADLGNKSNKVLEGHGELYWKGERGVAVFLKHPKCIRIKIEKNSSRQRDTCVATMINDTEMYDGELDQALRGILVGKGRAYGKTNSR